MRERIWAFLRVTQQADRVILGKYNMPSPQQILDGLSEISNRWQELAILWHLYFALLAFVLLMGVHPPKRVVGSLLGLPLLSVSFLAWLSGNPFNGITFGLSGTALIIVSIRLPKANVRISSWRGIKAGLLMFTFGWLYPHFLDTESFVPYLYSAPTGLIPCPTLSIAIGLALLLNGLDSRVWSAILGAMGIFYGLFGAVRLAVTIDWILLLGAALILILVFSRKGDEELSELNGVQNETI